MRLPGAIVSVLAETTGVGVDAAAGRLQTVGSPSYEQTLRLALRMSPARLAVTGCVPLPWATKVAEPAPSAVAAVWP